ncbi:hypothetical protein [Arthrobacter oryzae]|uniref:hypothetical protein n=1 Tax=Arthrobacter oryzae TaxID=409290 RepID=UPI00273B981D|nr:hypothetical protein [Arthrobacter oryzae]WLQ07171.1 hypothetical protein Q8Z05_03175 [Arthrobacter oryzae]
MTKTSMRIITGTIAGGLLRGVVLNLVLIPLLVLPILLSSIKVWNTRQDFSAAAIAAVHACTSLRSS